MQVELLENNFLRRAGRTLRALVAASRDNCQQQKHSEVKLLKCLVIMKEIDLVILITVIQAFASLVGSEVIHADGRVEVADSALYRTVHCKCC